MYTQCPECGTVFKVTPDVLRMARGVVRCGVCDATFNAVQSLSDQPTAVRAPRPLAAASSEPAADAGATPPGLRELHAKVAALQAQAPDDEPTGRHARPAYAGEPDEHQDDDADEEVLDIDAAATDVDSVFVYLGSSRAPDAAGAAASRVPGEHAEVPAGRGDPLPGRGTPRRPDAESYRELFRTTAAAAAGVQQRALYGRTPPSERATAPDLAEPQPGAGRPSRELIPDPLERTDHALSTDASTAVEYDAADPLPADDAHERARAATGASAEPASTPLPATEVLPARALPPLSITMPEPVPARRYGLVVAGFGLALALQVAHYCRESLAETPVIGATVQRLYDAIGLPIEPRWSVIDYDVKQLGAAGEVPGTLRVLARIQNRATRAQPYPLLRVTLLDRFETKIGRREFTPAEYLPSRRAPAGLLGADQRVDADLLLADPGTDAVSFELDVCLLFKNRVVCAQDAKPSS